MSASLQYCEPGLRSGAWRKMRVNRTQDFVIGGYAQINVSACPWHLSVLPRTRGVVLVRPKMSESSKAIDLQFKDKLIGVERLRAAGKPYRTHPAWTCTEYKPEGKFASSAGSVKLINYCLCAARPRRLRHMTGRCLYFLLYKTWLLRPNLRPCGSHASRLS